MIRRSNHHCPFLASKSYNPLAVNVVEKGPSPGSFSHNVINLGSGGGSGPSALPGLNPTPDPVPYTRVGHSPSGNSLIWCNTGDELYGMTRLWVRPRDADIPMENLPPSGEFHTVRWSHQPSSGTATTPDIVLTPPAPPDGEVQLPQGDSKEGYYLTCPVPSDYWYVPEPEDDKAFLIVSAPKDYDLTTRNNLLYTSSHSQLFIGFRSAMYLPLFFDSISPEDTLYEFRPKPKVEAFTKTQNKFRNISLSNAVRIDNLPDFPFTSLFQNLQSVSRKISFNSTSLYGFDGYGFEYIALGPAV